MSVKWRDTDQKPYYTKHVQNRSKKKLSSGHKNNNFLMSKKCKPLSGIYVQIIFQVFVFITR